MFLYRSSFAAADQALMHGCKHSSESVLGAETILQLVIANMILIVVILMHYIYTYIYIYIYMYTCTCICVYIYIYIYISMTYILYML